MKCGVVLRSVLSKKILLRIDIIYIPLYTNHTELYEIYIFRYVLCLMN
jgi:hypothetical protein